MSAALKNLIEVFIFCFLKTSILLADFSSYGFEVQPHALGLNVFRWSFFINLLVDSST